MDHNKKNFSGRVSFKNIFAGALVASVPAWISSAPIFGLNPIGISLVAFVGSCIGSYLIARKTKITDLHMTMTLGFLSCIIFNIFTFLLRYESGGYEAILPLLGFLLGGPVGAKYWNTKNADKLDESPNNISLAPSQ